METVIEQNMDDQTKLQILEPSIYANTDLDFLSDFISFFITKPLFYVSIQGDKLPRCKTFEMPEFCKILDKFNDLNFDKPPFTYLPITKHLLHIKSILNNPDFNWKMLDNLTYDRRDIFTLYKFKYGEKPILPDKYKEPDVRGVKLLVTCSYMTKLHEISKYPDISNAIRWFQIGCKKTIDLTNLIYVPKTKIFNTTDFYTQTDDTNNNNDEIIRYNELIEKQAEEIRLLKLKEQACLQHTIIWEATQEKYKIYINKLQELIEKQKEELRKSYNQDKENDFFKKNMEILEKDLKDTVINLEQEKNKRIDKNNECIVKDEKIFELGNLIQTLQNKIISLTAENNLLKDVQTASGSDLITSLFKQVPNLINSFLAELKESVTPTLQHISNITQQYNNTMHEKIDSFFKGANSNKSSFNKHINKMVNQENIEKKVIKSLPKEKIEVKVTEEPEYWCNYWEGKDIKVQIKDYFNPNKKMKWDSRMTDFEWEIQSYVNRFK